MKLNKKVRNIAIIAGIMLGLAVGCSSTEETTTDTEVTPSNQKIEASKGNDVIEEQEKETNTKEEVAENDSVPFEYKQAKEKAKDYMSFTSFSKKGLKEQLEFEGFSAEAAEWAVENYNADWNSQACAKARDYLDYTSFSKEGLKEQLLYEGFTEEEAQYAVDNVYK